MAVAFQYATTPAQRDCTVDIGYVRGDVALIDAIADEWDAVCHRGGYHQPFYRPSMARAYVESFAPDAVVVLVTARLAGRLVSVLPMVERTLGLAGFGLRWLHSTANAHFTAFDVVHADIDPDILAGEMWRFLSTHPGWDVIQIDSAPEGGIADRMRCAAMREGARGELHRPSATPYIPVDPVAHRSVEGILAGRSRSSRSQWRRAIRQLEQHGVLQLVRIGPEDGAQRLRQAVETFYELEHAGWKGTAGTSILSDPCSRAFYDRLVCDATLHQELVCHRLELNGRPITMEIGLESGRAYLGLKITYDEAYRRYSPGHLLTLYTLQNLARRGFEELNLGGTREPYKMAWTDHARPFGTVFLFHPGLRGRLSWRALFVVGPAIKRWWGSRSLPTALRRLFH